MTIHDILATDHPRSEIHMCDVGGDLLDGSQSGHETHRRTVVVEPLAPTTDDPQARRSTLGQPSRQSNESPKPTSDPTGESLGNDHSNNSIHFGVVVANSSATDQSTPATQMMDVGGATPWHELRAWAEQFAAVQQFRIAAQNRVRAANVDAGMFAAQIAAYDALEHNTDLALGRCYRRIVPAEIKGWQKLHPGLGVHLIGLLLGHLGNPAVATPAHWEGTGPSRHLVYSTPRHRTLSQLWSYCGLGDSTKRKTKGMTADELAALGNPQLKMLLHLLAESCMIQRVKHGGRYGDIYDLRRLITADRLHATDCVRCGPSGKPALTGSPWSKAHQHADALRIVSKEILRDLWLISRTISLGPISVRNPGDLHPDESINGGVA